MESSIAVFLMRQLACELLPTLHSHLAIPCPCKRRLPHTKLCDMYVRCSAHGFQIRSDDLHILRVVSSGNTCAALAREYWGWRRRPKAPHMGLFCTRVVLPM